jgi:hypothetical protein
LRSLIDLLGTIQTLEACNVDLYLDQQSIDTTTPAGRPMFQACTNPALRNVLYDTKEIPGRRAFVATPKVVGILDRWSINS